MIIDSDIFEIGLPLSFAMSFDTPYVLPIFFRKFIIWMNIFSQNFTNIIIIHSIKSVKEKL